MDPLSIAASAAGLLTLAATLVNLVDGIIGSINKQPALLKSIAADLETLQDVLSNLKDLDQSSQQQGDITALKSVLRGCNDVMQQLATELTSVKADLKRGRLARKYTQVTFSSRLESISTLRDQLDKYKSTLLIALSLRNLYGMQPVCIYA